MGNSLRSGIPPTTRARFFVSGSVDSIVLDSNLLLLLVVGLWNPRAIARHKRLSGLTVDDFVLLREFLGSFRKVVTTAHILTEVSNLAGSATGQTREAIFLQLSSLIQILDERTVSAGTLSRRAEFKIFGLTDAALCQLCSDSILLTEDGRLASYLRSRGLRALTLTDVSGLRDLANKS